MIRNPGEVEIELQGGKIDKKDIIECSIFSSIDNAVPLCFMRTTTEGSGKTLNLDEEYNVRIRLPDGSKIRFDDVVPDGSEEKTVQSETRSESQRYCFYPKDARENLSSGGVQRSIKDQPLNKLVSSFLSNDIKTSYKMDIRESNQRRGTDKQPFVLSAGTPFKLIEACTKQFALKGGSGDFPTFFLAPDSNGDMKYFYGAFSDLMKNKTGIDFTTAGQTSVGSLISRLEAFNAIGFDITRAGTYVDSRYKAFQTIARNFAIHEGEYLGDPSGSAREGAVRSVFSGLGRNHQTVTNSGKYLRQIPRFFDGNEVKIPKHLYSEATAAHAKHKVRSNIINVALPLTTNKISVGSVISARNMQAGPNPTERDQTLTGDILVLATYMNITQHDKPNGTIMIQGTTV